MISVTVVFIVNVHILFGYEKINLSDKQSYESYDCNIRQDNIFYKTLFDFYDSYIESIFLIVIPFFIMLICSLLIIFQIFRTRKTIRYNKKGKFYYYTFYTRETIQQTFRKRLKERRKVKLRDKDVQLCWMLIGTTLAFLILCLPTEINDIFNYKGREHSCLDWFRKVILMLIQQIYYAGHFYIYTLTGPLFRKHLFAIIFDRNRHLLVFSRESQFFRARHVSNRENQYQHQTNTTNYSEDGKLSIMTTNFINTTTHQTTRATATGICEINKIHSEDNYTSYDSPPLSFVTCK